MSPADLRLVPKPKPPRLAWRGREEWSLYDLLIPGLGAVWVWWVSQEPWLPAGTALLLLLVCLLKRRG